MFCFVNGKQKEFINPPTIEAVLKESLDSYEGVVVVLDEKVVSHENWSTTVIKDNQRLELLCFVSGG